MSAGKLQRRAGKLLRWLGKLSRACCCGGGYDPGEPCDQCDEGETPAAWTLTVDGMSLCCVWQWNTIPTEPVRYEWFSIRLSDADPNGTFCLRQCEGNPCQWVSDRFGADIYYGDSALGEEASLVPPTAETACASWASSGHWTTPLRWVLWWDVRDSLLGGQRWRLQLILDDTGWVVWETTVTCANDQEIDNTAVECEEGHEAPWPLIVSAVCSETPYEFAYELGGAAGGELLLLKGCGD